MIVPDPVVAFADVYDDLRDTAAQAGAVVEVASIVAELAARMRNGGAHVVEVRIEAHHGAWAVEAHKWEQIA
jgi:hypothetical protein